MAKLIFGCGYLGHRVAKRWTDRGETVHVVTRSVARAEEFLQSGLQPHIADITQPETLIGLPHATTVLFAVGLDRSTGDSIKNVYVHGLRHVLAALITEGCPVERFIYISSTGVYGQSAGEWVDEDSPCGPTREGGQACLAAEQLLVNHAIGGKAVILRMAGIYGPNRLPRKRDLQRQKPMLVADGYLNLIHVDDAADIVLAADAYAAESSRLPAKFVVADGNPVKRRTYYTELARLLQLGKPEFCVPDLGQPGAARRMGSKRARTTRLMQELQPNLNFPSYREGLAASVGVVDDASGGS